MSAPERCSRHMDAFKIILDRLEQGEPLTPAEQRTVWGLLGFAPNPTFRPCLLVEGPNGREKCCG